MRDPKLQSTRFGAHAIAEQEVMGNKISDRSRRACLVVLLSLCWPPRVQSADLADVAAVTQLSRSAIYGEAASVPTGRGFDFTVVVVRNAGWRADEIETAIREAAAIFLHRCGLPISVNRVLTIDLPGFYQELDEAEEERFVGGLVDRPAALFVNATTEHHNAYSYLESWPISRAGTVWITRDAPTVCRGPLLAHEIGHVALDQAEHSDDQDNLMSHRCGHSNLTNQRINTELSQRQCTLLKRRFCADGAC
jgi:hypothetical protein